ncbi:UBXN6 [Bugula neritina]|uniref:UBXN6 n=1 Tax=Bugula neritina TaxID=10212 RepID=A0A7J7JTE3_BUGNE|nr:UBXN6 [Bugula neritina]
MNHRPTTPSARTGRDVIKAQVKREMEDERRLREEVVSLSSRPKEVHADSSHVTASCGGVFFTSHLLPGVMASKQEVDEKIKAYLTEQLKEDAEMASALLIHTVNKDVEKVRVCIETLCRYIDNLLENPGVEKFRKIRCSNKAFQERVASVTGGTQFLLCAGYEQARLPGPNNAEEDFFIISEESSIDIEKLNLLKEVLINSEPIRAELWRAVRLFHCPTTYGSRFGELPDEFYAVSKEEIKREQQAKRDAVEKLGMLRTKAMRERDELKELRRYRYTLLRIRFPGDIYLQAIFKANEKLQDLLNFLKEYLLFDWIPFWILSPSGQKLTNEEKTLAELQLVPACVINFAYDKELFSEALQGKSSHVLQQSILDRLENWGI